MVSVEWLRRPGGGPDWPRVLLVALAATVVLAVGVTAATSTASFGLYNPGWDGASDLRSQIQAEPGVEDDLLRDTEKYEEIEPDGTVAFVVAPDDPYTGEDAERLRTFVEGGGTLVVFENFGEGGNAVMSEVGADARFHGDLLRDEQNHFRGPPMPIADNVTDHELTSGVSQLTLNYATAVEPGEATVLVRTSGVTYLGEEETDLSEANDLASYPVATVENASAGTVVAVGDPSITINAMLSEPDNAAFVSGLYEDADRVVLDASHVGDVPPLAAATLTLRDSPLLQVLVGLAAIGAVAALSAREVPTDRLRRTRSGRARDVERAEPGGELSTADRTAYLRKQYPDWDDDRIERVTAAVERAEEGDPARTASDEHDP